MEDWCWEEGEHSWQLLPSGTIECPICGSEFTPGEDGYAELLADMQIA